MHDQQINQLLQVRVSKWYIDAELHSNFDHITIIYHCNTSKMLYNVYYCKKINESLTHFICADLDIRLGLLLFLFVCHHMLDIIERF